MQEPGGKTNTRGVLLFFLRRHWTEFVALTAVALAVGILEGFNLALFVPMLNDLVGMPLSGKAYAGHKAISLVYQLIAYIPINDQFLAAGGLFLSMTFLKGGLSIFHEFISAKMTGRFLHQYRMEQIHRYNCMPLPEYQEARIGAMVYDLTQPPIMVTRLLYMLPRLVVDGMRFLFVLLLLLYIEPTVTMAIMGGCLFMYMPTSRRTSLYLYRLGLMRRTVEQNMSSIASEWFRGFRAIRIGGAEPHWIGGFSSNSQKAREAYVRTSVALASPRHVFEMVGFSLLLVGLMWSYSESPDGFREQLATISVLALGMIRILPSIAALTRAPLDIRSTMPDVEYMYRQMTEPLNIEEHGREHFPGLAAQIELDDVDVCHGERIALCDVSMSICRGEVVAIVGASGSGKSTLLNVLMGTQQPTKGRVQYDSCELKHIEKKSLLERIGYVGQDAALFFGTIRENIAFFRPDVSLENIKAAAGAAEIADFIESLPEGYETRVGEGGANLSGGQMQRIAIARAVLNNPEILILDEPTSALDAASEQAVLNALQHAAMKRTVVMVTHKLSSVSWVDRIYVLASGRVVQTGTYDELMSDPSGVFSQMNNAAARD